jgi:uncharacterized NTF2-like protein DUF6841
MTKHQQPDFDQFFEQYAELLGRFDGAAIADLYGYPCLMVADNGVAAGMDRQNAIDGVNNMATLYKPTGFERAVAKVTSVDSLSDRLALVRVNWDFRAAGDRSLYQNDTIYLFRADDEGAWLINAAITIDDPERLAQLLGGR